MKRNRPYIPLIPAILVIFVLAGNYLGCETEDWMLTVDCDECYGAPPDSANLIVYLTINQENRRIPITVYRGSADEGIIDWQDTATQSEYYLYSALDTDYTVEATYRSGAKIILTYDGDHMFLYDGGDECGAPCYIVKGGIFDNLLLE